MKRTLSYIFRGLAWMVCLVILLALLIASPIIAGWKPVVVLSGSMEPAYPVGSVIYYHSASFEEISVGDAITFRFGDSALATHRVVEKNEAEKTFSTKGDNNDSADPVPVQYASVVGKSSRIAIPYAGFFARYIKNWYLIAGMGLILLIDALLAPEKNEKQHQKFSSHAFQRAKAAEPAKPASSALSAKEYFKDL